MNTILIAGLLAALGASPARAQESSVSYGGGARFVDLDTRGSRGQVMEYDGKQYFIGHGDVSVSAEGPKGLIDLDFRDLGSTEENGQVYADMGDWLKTSFKFNRMSHRQNMTDFGIIVNGQFVKIPAALTRQLFPGDLNMIFKRTETELNLALTDPENSARWLALQYWTVLKNGTAPSGYYTGGLLIFDEANIDNTTHELVIGAGREATEKGAVAVDIIRRDFAEDAGVKKFGNATSAVRPALPNLQMLAAELRFRYDPSKKLALTGALTGRQRENLFSQYKMNAAVAAFNAAYKATDKLSLTARLYGRMVEMDESLGFINVVSNNPPANTHQIDTLSGRGDFALTWRPVKAVLLKAGYKVELTHRRDAPSEIFAGAGYTDGTVVYFGQHANSVANDVFKQTLTVGAKSELPFGASADAEYKRMAANRAAFVNMPTQSDEANFGVNLPLPGRVEMYVLAQYLNERNSIQYTQSRLTRNAYRTGIDWESENKVFIGADASYDTTRRFTEGWFGASTNWNAVFSNPATVGYEHVAGMYNRQNNTTAGLHGRVNLPKGFVVKANGSYTWATVATPLNMQPRTDPGQFIGDITPGDVRIARGSVGVEFTPAKYKNLTARAGYRVDDWVDKYDPDNSGRASYTQVGVSAKF